MVPLLLNPFFIKKSDMLQTATLNFLKKLKANNKKEWMDANRDAYLDAKADFEAFTGALLLAVAKNDPSIAHLQAKDCTFRINRDVRFSKNKDPYKTNMACYITRGGKKGAFAGYYCHVEPGKAFMAGGIWMPEAPVLKKLCQEIDYNFNDFKKIVNSKKFNATFGDLDRSEGVALSRPPKGYDVENPAIEYLKMKSFIATVPLDDNMLTDKGLVKHLAALFTTLKPFIDFLNMGVEEE
jgi:uncharacterized protein (TIGR02453 family)